MFTCQALIYPLMVACKSSSPARQNAANKVLTSMCEHSNTLVQQAMLVSTSFWFNKSCLLCSACRTLKYFTLVQQVLLGSARNICKYFILLINSCLCVSHTVIRVELCITHLFDPGKIMYVCARINTHICMIHRSAVVPTDQDYRRTFTLLLIPTFDY